MRAHRRLCRWSEMVAAYRSWQKHDLPNTVLPLLELQLWLSLLHFGHLLVLCSRALSVLWFRELNRPGTSTKWCIFTCGSLAGSGDHKAAPRPPECGTQLHFSTTLLAVCGCSILGHLPVLGECYSLPHYLELISGEGLWFPGWPLLALEHTKLLISEF